MKLLMKILNKLPHKTNSIKLFEYQRENAGAFPASQQYVRQALIILGKACCLSYFLNITKIPAWRTKTMGKMINRLTCSLFVFFFLLILGCQEVQVKRDQEELSSMPGTMPAKEDPVLGLQSQQARGEQHVLILAVKFPDVEPIFSLERIRSKVAQGLNEYVKEQSYGLTWVKADFRGWIKLPDPIRKYKVSPRNFEVDRTRVKKLIEDSMTAVEKEVNFSQYQHIIVIPGASTTPGKGYGMICYCANPGMLSGVKRNAGYVPLESKGGKPFRGGVCVAAENAHLGMFAHDFFHALGGIHKDKRLVP
jgi:hypothetical protein